MSQRIAAAAQDMSPETTQSLNELIRGLRDNASYLNEAADSISDDQYVSNTLRSIAGERQQIMVNIGGFIELADETAAEDGSFLGSLRTIWTAFRAGLNAGDPTVVLIEAERAEDAIVAKFKTVLPELAGNPINDRLNDYYRTVKSGHDRVRSLRDAYKSEIES